MTEAPETPVENPLDARDTDAARAYAEERRENIRTFVRTSPDYYIAQFDTIGESARRTRPGRRDPPWH